MTMGKIGSRQGQFIYFNLEDFVPKDHLLRQINDVIDFNFIYEKVSHLYSERGRKSVDPVLLVKMLLLGYLYGIKSERRLEEEVRMNLGYRWFLGISIEDPVPDHSTISQNRRRRFKDSFVFQEIFDQIVIQCIELGLVDGEIVVTDSTHIKACASEKSSKVEKVYGQPAAYLESLDEEIRKYRQKEMEKRNGEKARGRKPLPLMPIEKTVIKSSTDPDAGYMSRPGKPKGFHYLAHTSIDTKIGIVTDIHVTAGNVNDHEPYVERIKRQTLKLGINIQKVGADAGYDMANVHRGLESLGITGFIVPAKVERSVESKGFAYSAEKDCFLCPGGKELHFSHVDFQKDKNHYRLIYQASQRDCSNCPLRGDCLSASAKARRIRVPIHHASRRRNKERYGTPDYFLVQKLRKVWAEGAFAIMKRHHNLKETYKRGIEKMKEQCLFSALALNIKRMVKMIVPSSLNKLRFSHSISRLLQI